MTPARLVIAEDGYTLLHWQGGRWTELAALAGGASALLPTGYPMNDARLERAIELAENWLMPHAARLAGAVLEVRDATGRVTTSLSELLSVTTRAWSLDEVEAMFLRLVELAGGRASQVLNGRQAFVADVLLLRELIHHGRLRRIQLA